MASGQERFITQLEQAARRVEIMSPDEISSLFRRAALRLRNIGNHLSGLDGEYQPLIDEMNADADGAT